MKLPNVVVAESTIALRHLGQLSFLSCRLHLHRLHRPVLVVEALGGGGARWIRTGAGALLTFERIADTELTGYRELEETHGMKRVEARRAA